MAAHRYTCVAIDGRGILLSGPAGSGKSSLALALIDRGARLVGDDGVELVHREGRLRAGPHPNARGVIEVRNLGLVPMDFLESAPVCLHIALDEGAPRYVEGPETTEIAGVPVPTVLLRPDSSNLAIKAELALERFGLSD